MPRVIFSENFDWHVKPNVTVHHKAGNEYVVTQACAALAIAAGKGRLAPAPSLISKAKVVTDAGD